MASARRLMPDRTRSFTPARFNRIDYTLLAWTVLSVFAAVYLAFWS